MSVVSHCLSVIAHCMKSFALRVAISVVRRTVTVWAVSVIPESVLIPVLSLAASAVIVLGITAIRYRDLIGMLTGVDTSVRNLAAIAMRECVIFICINEGIDSAIEAYTMIRSYGLV